MKTRIQFLLACLATTFATMVAQAQSHDTTFGVSMPYWETAYTLAIERNANVLVGGTFTSIDAYPRTNIARLSPTGRLVRDSGFTAQVHDRVWPFLNWVFAICVEEDGGVLVGGNFDNVTGVPRDNVARLLPGGTLDPDYRADANGTVWGIAKQADGKSLAWGTFDRIGGVARTYIARLHPSGAVDMSFAPNVNWHIVTALPLANGKIIIGGFFWIVDGQPRNGVARLNSDGSLDTTFVPPHAPLWAVAEQPDGKLVIGGEFGGLGNHACTNIGRLNADGSVDTSFQAATSGTIMASRPRTLVLQSDGRILVGGSFWEVNGVPRRGIARLNTDGSVDGTFEIPDNPVAVNAIALQQDGKILYSSGNLPTGTSSNVIRLNNNVAAIDDLQIDLARNSITWLRGGAAPELMQVRIELSVDGTNFLATGTPARVAEGWRLQPISFPNGRFDIRARGRATGGWQTGSSGIIETIESFVITPPLLNAMKLPGGAFSFELMAAGEADFTVVAATNPALPLVQWEVLGKAASVSNGIYRFIDSAAANHPQRFYMLR